MKIAKISTQNPSVDPIFYSFLKYLVNFINHILSLLRAFL